MAHFAIVENNVVTSVLVVNNDVIIDENGVEQEELGKRFLNDVFGYDKDSVVQTSYNSSFRDVYATIGDWYNKDLDIFVKKYDELGNIYDIDGNIVGNLYDNEES